VSETSRSSFEMLRLVEDDTAALRSTPKNPVDGGAVFA
jgi:hypothetical protein